MQMHSKYSAGVAPHAARNSHVTMSLPSFKKRVWNSINQAPAISSDLGLETPSAMVSSKSGLEAPSAMVSLESGLEEPSAMVMSSKSGLEAPSTMVSSRSCMPAGEMVCLSCKQKMMAASDGAGFVTYPMEAPAVNMIELAIDREPMPAFAKRSELPNPVRNHEQSVTMMQNREFEMDMDFDFATIDGKEPARSPSTFLGVESTTNGGGKTIAANLSSEGGLSDGDDFMFKGSASFLKKLIKKGISPVLHRELIAEMRYHGKMSLLKKPRYGRRAARLGFASRNGAPAFRPNATDGQIVCADDSHMGASASAIGERIISARNGGKTYGKSIVRLEHGTPSISIVMNRSAVSSGFFLHIPTTFCREFLPDCDTWITFEDEYGYTWRSKYLAKRSGLSAGWRRLALEKRLQFGEIVTFSKISDDHFYFRSSNT